MFNILTVFKTWELDTLNEQLRLYVRGKKHSVGSARRCIFRVTYAKDRITELATTLQDIEIQLTGMELQHDVIHILYELVTNLLTYFTSY